mmetsp:Transcript_39653/g.38231  ORF Transcript_39653/g.38231 Transcript_39653/m.38231 type:complete len:197 (+) Transcript_39653:386-976(+)
MGLLPHHHFLEHLGGCLRIPGQFFYFLIGGVGLGNLNLLFDLELHPVLELSLDLLGLSEEISELDDRGLVHCPLYLSFRVIWVTLLTPFDVFIHRIQIAFDLLLVVLVNEHEGVDLFSLHLLGLSFVVIHCLMGGASQLRIVIFHFPQGLGCFFGPGNEIRDEFEVLLFFRFFIFKQVLTQLQIHSFLLRCLSKLF